MLPDFSGGAVNITGYPVSAGGAQIQSTQIVTKDPNYTLLDGTSIGEGSSGGQVWIATSQWDGSRRACLQSLEHHDRRLRCADHRGRLHSDRSLDAAGDGSTLPTIISTVASQTVSDQGAISPFFGVTVADLNPGQTETVTVVLSTAGNGILTNLAGGSYAATTGVYTDSGSAAAITAALNGLVFIPTVG